MNTDFEFSFPQQIESFYRQLVELLLHDIDSLDDDEKQKQLLLEEGVEFDSNDRIDLDRFMCHQYRVI